MTKAYYANSIIKKMRIEAQKILKLDYSNKTQDELKQLIQIEKEKVNPNRIVVFGVVIEAFKRTIGIQPYENQIIGGIALDTGYLSELKTGEGKTYTAVFPSVLNSFKGKVYNVTVNDYLSKRDFEKTEPVFNYLGIRSSWNQPIYEQGEIINGVEVVIDKPNVYSADVVFTSGGEFIFDYLRNDVTFSLDTVLIDEVDFVLIDNANSKFSISTEGGTPASEILIANYKLANALVLGLNGGKIEGRSLGRVNEDKYSVDYIFSQHEKSVGLTIEGFKKLEKLLNVESLEQNLELYKAILDMLFVHVFIFRNRDYIIDSGKVILINRENGRLMPNSKKENGIQTAIEIKENVTVSDVTATNNEMSYQLYFSKFKKMIGMSGTVMEAESEFKGIFNVPSLEIPTNKNSMRVDFDTIYFFTKREKYEYMKKAVQEANRIGKPVLLVTESETESFAVKKMLGKIKVKARILNAITTREEESIIKNAGKKGNVTISTNMSGRGTDIEIDEEVESLGGLFVLSVNKYESNRIDNQVRGRSGRQGQKGSCMFLSSLEDAIFNHVSTEDYLKIKSKKQSEFYSSAYQRYIDKEIVGKTQVVLNAIFETGRKALFGAGKVEYVFKENILNQAKLIVNCADQETLNKILDDWLLEELTIALKKLKENMDYETYYFLGAEMSQEIELNVTKRAIMSQIDEKIANIEFVVARNLMEQILIHLFKREWNHFKDILNDCAVINGVYSNANNESLSKFIVEGSIAYDDFRHQLTLEMFDMFLKANKTTNNN